jgi:hypothetical protein
MPSSNTVMGFNVMKKSLGSLSSLILISVGFLVLPEAVQANDATSRIQLTCGMIGTSAKPEDILRFAAGGELDSDSAAVLRTITRFCGTSEESLRTALNKTFTVANADAPSVADRFAAIEPYVEQFHPFIVNNYTCDDTEIQEGEADQDEATARCMQTAQSLIRGAIAYALFNDFDVTASPASEARQQFTLADVIRGLQHRGIPTVRIDVPAMLDAVQ